jgi:hypothetical protein
MRRRRRRKRRRRKSGENVEEGEEVRGGEVEGKEEDE